MNAITQRHQGVAVTLPLRTSNPLNGTHGHWSVKAKRRKAHRTATHLAVRAARPPGLPVDVVLTRVAPSGGLDPHDGLGAALKGCIDGVADALGIDDRDERVSWTLKQRRGPWAVEIQIAQR